MTHAVDETRPGLGKGLTIVTCANSDTARDYQKGNRFYKGFSFRRIIEATYRRATECGYRCLVFDLGTLGIGEPYAIDDATFLEKGYYAKEVIRGYKSKSLFKPSLVQTVMDRHDSLIAYLDGDAQLVGSISEIAGADYDVGVTLRPMWETNSQWHQEHFEIVKYLNAGVIFFNPTEAARQFVERWKYLTAELGNDQMALNRICCPARYPATMSVERIDGVRIKYFPCERYNFYFFDDLYPHGAKILHFKGSVRNFYPFGWRNRSYCYLRNTLAGLRRRM